MPCRERKAIGIGFPVDGDGDGWCKMLTGAEGLPHGVVGLMVATCVKSASEARPVPPITAMWTGSFYSGSALSREVRHVVLTIVVVCYAGHFAMTEADIPTDEFDVCFPT